MSALTRHVLYEKTKLSLTYHNNSHSGLLTAQLIYHTKIPQHTTHLKALKDIKYNNVTFIKKGHNVPFYSQVIRWGDDNCYKILNIVIDVRPPGIYGIAFEFKLLGDIKIGAFL
jgi:hypothetical protein